MVPSSNLNVTSATGTKKQARCESAFKVELRLKNLLHLHAVNQGPSPSHHPHPEDQSSILEG